jgi:hypothetical protein
VFSIDLSSYGIPYHKTNVLYSGMGFIRLSAIPPQGIKAAPRIKGKKKEKEQKILVLILVMGYILVKGALWKQRHL